MNPYASFLGTQNPIQVIQSTAADLKTLVEGPAAHFLDREPAPGKWSVEEILSHLADTEIVFAMRIRQTLAETAHVIQPFDQDAWAKTYAAYSASQALETFTVVRAWNVKLILALKPADFDRTVTHPERGTMTLRTVIETMGGHDLNHIAQIRGMVRYFDEKE